MAPASPIILVCGVNIYAIEERGYKSDAQPFSPLKTEAEALLCRPPGTSVSMVLDRKGIMRRSLINDQVGFAALQYPRLFVSSLQ